MDYHNRFDWVPKYGSGFMVEDAASTTTIQNLTEATQVLNGTNQRSKVTKISPVVNFHDPSGEGGSGNFGSDELFPNDTDGDDNDFAIRATGQIVIPREGVWTFGINSDDGARLTINRQTVINDNTQHGPEDHLGQIELEAGVYPLELTYFERGGGAEVELFAVKGIFPAFSTRFRLVGDTDNDDLPFTLR